MSRRLFIVALAVALVPFSARAAEEENPFKKAKVGDWVSYKMTTSAAGQNFEGKIKMTVTAKDDKSATVLSAVTVNNIEMKGQEVKIDLTKPYDPIVGAVPQNVQAKIEKGKSGNEKIKVGGKEYDCTWQEMKVSAEVAGMKFDSEIKVWMSKAVPLGGTVKMEVKSQIANMSVELLETGSTGPARCAFHPSPKRKRGTKPIPCLRFGLCQPYVEAETSMITGVHTMFYTSQPEELRAFLRDKLKFPFTDVGDGWLIFDLPPAEMGCHPSEEADGQRSGTHYISFYCDDIHKTVAELKGRGVEFVDGVTDAGYGFITHFKVPGGFAVQLYQPKYRTSAGVTKLP